MALPEPRQTESAMVARPPAGRVFERTFHPGFADCTPSRRMRLDSLARWLQDVAYDDVADAGLADAAVWVLRRTRIEVRRWPQFGEQYKLATFCSGMARMWAERRTIIAGPGGIDVEAAALWVHLEPETLRPVPLSQAEIDLYGPPAGGRRVTARLRHPTPPADAPTSRWSFRATELDIADHINNSAYWQPLEHELLESPDPDWIEAEVEFRSPAQPGQKLLISDGGSLRGGALRWIADPQGDVHGSILVSGVG